MSIVSNTTPLSELAKIGQLGLLRALFGEVIIPHEVFAEVTCGSHPAAREVPSAGWIRVRPVARPEDVEAFHVRTRLGLGECAAIIVAEELGTGEVLMDDRAARLEAEDRGLAVTGTVAVLLLAKRRGLIPTVGEHIDALISHGSRIGRALYRDALALAGE